MTAVILSFQKAVALRNHRLGVVENIVKNQASVNSVTGHSSFFLNNSQIDYLALYNTFNKNMLCRYAIFKYPSILAKFRRGINPVSAIYNEMQKVLLLDNNDAYSVWLMSLFDNKEWVAKLIHALDTDIKSISKITNEYQ